MSTVAVSVPASHSGMNMERFTATAKGEYYNCFLSSLALFDALAYSFILLPFPQIFPIISFFSVDDKGAQWCYISSTHYSSCEDLQLSSKFPNNPWSYTACATPDLSSYECQALSTPTDSYGSSSFCKDGKCLSGAAVTAYTGSACKCPECPVDPKHPAGTKVEQIIALVGNFT